MSLAALDASMLTDNAAGAWRIAESPEELLGHENVGATMIYTHVFNRGPGGVRSPVDSLTTIADEPHAPGSTELLPQYPAARRRLTPPGESDGR
jgi:hypothetical protein